MNCWDCKHSETNPGDCHLTCRKGMNEVFKGASTDTHVKLNPHGVKMGWAYWPLNFDPVWIESCDGFEAQECVT